MTTTNLITSLTAAARRPSRRGLSAILSMLLCAAALPAVAAPGLAADSADQVRIDSASETLVGSAIATDRGLLFASDVNEIIAAQAEAPAQTQGRVQTMLKRALALLGTPYRWGGTSPDGGFDCSGLVGYVFRTALGIELPRVSRDMANDGEKVERTALSAGDLVFFSRLGKRVDHVGIYLGNGQFVHAPRTGKDVMVSDLDKGYWNGKFLQARRVAGI